MTVTGPEAFDVLLAKAKHCLERSDFDGAISCYRKLLKIAPNNAALYFNLGNAQNQVSDLESAIASYHEAIERQPELRVAHLSLGLAYEKQGKKGLAEEHYLAASKDRNLAYDAYVRLSTMMITLKKHDQGLHYAAKAREADPASKVSGMLVCAHASALKQHQKVVSVASQMLANDPKDVQAKKYLGEALCRLSQTAKGLELLKQASDESLDGLLSCFASLVFYTGKTAINELEKYALLIKGILSRGEINGRKLPSGLGIELSFPLARYLHDAGDYSEAMRFLSLGNSLKRRTFQYDTNKMDAYFRRTEEYVELLQDYQLSPQPGPRLIFVVGLPRSGTSLVEQILASHSSTYGCGELELANRARAKFDAQSTRDSNRTANIERLLAEFRDAYLQGLKGFPQSDVLIDKMPDNFHHIPLLLAAFPEAKIVICTRQPLENAFSIYRQNFQGMHPYAYTPSELKHYIDRYSILVAKVEAVYAPSVHKISYESLVENTEAEVRSLLDFAELDFEAECLEFYANKRVVNTASAAQVRQKIYRSSLAVVDRYPEFITQWTGN